MMIASHEQCNRQLVSDAITKDTLEAQSAKTKQTRRPSELQFHDFSASSIKDDTDKPDGITPKCAAVDHVQLVVVEPDEDKGSVNSHGSNTQEGCMEQTDVSHKQKRKIIRSLFDTVQRALKTDSRHVSSSRFTEELAWTEVYGPLYRSLQKKDSADVGVLLEALGEKQEPNIRCALLSAIHQAILAGVADDMHAVASSLIRYSEVVFKDNKDSVTEAGEDQRKGPIDRDIQSLPQEFEIWLMAIRTLMHERILPEDDEMSLWMACWGLLPNTQVSLLLQELAISLENPLILRSICDFLLATKDSDLIPMALQLLSSQLLKSSDSAAAKAIIFQALNHKRYFSECIHAWKQLSNVSKAELEIFVEAVVLRQLRSRQNVESCLEYLDDISQTAFLFANFDCDTHSSNLWEAVIEELARVAFEKTIKVDDRPQSSEVVASESIPSTSMRGSVVTVIPDRQPMNHMNALAIDTLIRVASGISDLVDGLSLPPTDLISFCSSPKAIISRDADLHAQKCQKIALESVCHSFNDTNPERGEFLEVALAEGLIEATTDPAAVATILHEARSLDKQKLGIYLSQGPENDYPFQASLRREYASLVSFRGLSFSDSLRKFLSNFRLPGEAQCIDRLMEAFSEELHKQHNGAMVFKNSDAVYVLAFSTIMLNTDLHNPTIRSDLRMTKDQFIRNNRGINNGEDLPEEFLNELYENIKGQELHVFRGLDQFMQFSEDNFDIAWSDVLAQPRKPFVVPELGPSKSSASLRDMFQLFAGHALPSLLNVVKKSWNDRIVHQTIESLEKMMMLSDKFELNHFTNDVLESLLPCGCEYALRCTVVDPCTSDAMAVEASKSLPSNDSVQDDEETLTNDQVENLIPFGLLHSGTDVQTYDSAGSAEHRGLLALDRTFMFFKKNPTSVQRVWTLFVDCLCALRDLKALPAGMSNLDDFADSEGNVLPLSSFAKVSQKRLEDHQKFLSGKGHSKQKGWFRFFRNKKGVDLLETTEGGMANRPKVELSNQAKALLGVAVAANVENIVQHATSEQPEQAVKMLLSKLDAYPFDDDPRGEQHAVFALELAARALLSNQTRSAETYLPFLSQFESILCRITETENEEVPAPFVIERIVVTILRSCIHLYEFDELRPHLRASLQLLIMTLPRQFVRAISDRMACGLAIILRASFQYFQSQEWSFMGDTLDVLANYGLSRVFVFDGIASTVEFALTDVEQQKPELSLEGCGILSRILTRFVLGFYQSDMSLVVPSMLCLEKVYRHKVFLMQSPKGEDDECEALAVPDLDFWQNVAVAVYSVCRSSDADRSQEGLECFQRIVLRSAVNQVPGHKWTAIFYLMVNKQPPVTAELSRVNTFSLLGQVMTTTVATLSHDSELRDDLDDFVNQFAGLAEENLQQSRRGNLFKGTLQTLTYVSNHFVSEEWSGDKDFGRWASEVLLKELERVGREVKPTTTVNAKEEEDVSEISDSAAESEADN